MCIPTTNIANVYNCLFSNNKNLKISVRREWGNIEGGEER